MLTGKRTCAHCNETKEIINFIYSHGGNRSVILHDKCQRCHNRRSNNSSKKQKLKNMELVNEAKKSGCIFCGENIPVLLDMHHLDPSTKLDNISHMVNNGSSSSQLKEELEKCVPMC